MAVLNFARSKMHYLARRTAYPGPLLAISDHACALARGDAVCPRQRAAFCHDFGAAGGLGVIARHARADWALAHGRRLPDADAGRTSPLLAVQSRQVWQRSRCQ